MIHAFQRRHTHAFTLVELSVVLVIIGLLVGGVLAGQRLIQAAELRSTIREIEQIRAAFLLFTDKYGHIPGDMPNATDFWGTKSGGCPNTAQVPGACNGDGNGIFAHPNEDTYAWEHLILAGLLPDKNLSWGQYLRESGEGFYYIHSGDLYFSIPGYGNDFPTLILTNENSNNGMWNRAVLTPIEAWKIDKKLDDGKPLTGKIFGHKGNDPEITTDCHDGTDYNIDEENQACRLIIIIK